MNPYRFDQTNDQANQDTLNSSGNRPGTASSAGNRSATSNSSRSRPGTSEGTETSEKWGPAGNIPQSNQDNDLIRRPPSANNQNDSVSRQSSTPESSKSSSRVSMRLPSEGGSSRGIPVIPGLKSLNFDNSADSVRDRVPSNTGKWSVRSQTYEELETLTRLLRENQERIIDKIIIYNECDTVAYYTPESIATILQKSKNGKGDICIQVDSTMLKSL